MSKSPAARTNDGHQYTSRATSPISRTLRKVADLVLHDRVVQKEKLSKRPHTARFTDEQVRLMRLLHVDGKVTTAEFALLLGMSTAQAKKILDGTNYSKVL